MVTGAGSGMGRAYAQAFARLGARLALNDYSAESLRETLDLLEQEGFDNVYSDVFDVADQAAMNAFAEQVRQQLGSAHVIINNAGVAGGGVPLMDMPGTAFERTMDINFWGVVYGTQAFLPQLVENNEGAVVNVSSVFGLIGVPNSGDYAASKFAVRGYTEALMAEFAKSPISIHLVHPGGINTNIATGANVEDQESAVAFANAYLTTPPEKMVQHVIKCIGRRQPKIVYGKDALRIWLASNFVPLSVLTKLLWREYSSKNLLDHTRYARFIPGLKK